MALDFAYFQEVTDFKIQKSTLVNNNHADRTEIGNIALSGSNKCKNETIRYGQK